MGIEFGLFGLILLALNIYAVIKILQSGAGAGAKAIWIILILVFPLIGLIAWFIAGPKGELTLRF